MTPKKPSPDDPFRKKVKLYILLVILGLIVLHLALLADLYDILRGVF